MTELLNCVRNIAASNLRFRCNRITTMFDSRSVATPLLNLVDVVSNRDSKNFKSRSQSLSLVDHSLTTRRMVSSIAS